MFFAAVCAGVIMKKMSILVVLSAIWMAGQAADATGFSDSSDKGTGDLGTSTPANGLLLWNRLGSADQITNSEVGPSGTYTAGTFVPGPFGNALELNMQQQFGCTFPISLLDTAEGCLEFWAKLSDFPVQMPWDGCNPGLIGYPRPVGDDGYLFYFNANNGVADGGLCAGTHLGHVGTGPYGSWTYSQAIGGGDVAEWHHYALVWNAKGLPGIGNGTRKVAIFVDGVQIASHGAYYDEVRLIGEPDVHVFGLLNHHGITGGRVAFDNLKVWNYAKTDFSDRFDEDENDPDTPSPANGLLLWNRLGSADQIANSEVGPSGTYTAGTFVPGPFGNALELNMQQQFGCTFPISLLRQEKGCIEFWAKLSDFPAQMPFSKCVPSLIGCGTLSNPEYYLFFFSANDGNGNGGLCVRCGYGYAGTGLYGSWTYSQAIGGGNVVEWHHYALVWNANGLPEIGDGTRKVGIFLDGQLISESGFFHDNHPLCLADLPDPYVFGLLNHHGITGGRVAFDNLKVWNYAKTDFSDRFDEDAGDPGTPTPANELLLWNRLGSEDQIANSEVGPSGTYTAGTFVPGPFGDALELNMQQQLGCTFPISLLDTAEGCLEFWAKLSDFPVQMPWDGCNPGLIGYPRPVGDDGYLFYFNANNGVADGGLCAGTHLGHIGTGSFGNWTYSQAIGGGNVAEWHHYALVWNAKGLPGIGDGTRKVTIFVDGVQIANHGAFYNEERLIGEPNIHVFGLLNHHGITGGRVAFDNLKIWNYAKTDFSDRFTEGEVVTYDVTVSKGSIDGTTSNSFPAATLLNVRADTPPTGWHFASWTVEPEDADLGSTFDALQAETSLIMPSHAITLTAVWAPDATSLSNGLQLYYPFTSAAEGATDASGNGHDGVLHGTTWQDDGRPSGSRRLGSGNYIDVGIEVNFAAWEQYSISLWFKRDLTPIDATGYGDKLLCKTDWYSDQHLRMLPGGSLHFTVTTGGGPYPSTGYGVDCWENFQDNMWHHYVVVRSNNLATLWIDGIQKSATSNAISIASNTKPLYLGYSASGDAYQRRYWPGNLDELRIYNRALAPHEIDELLYGETRRLTVAFDVNGGEQAPTNTIVIMGTPYGELPQPSRTGYTFGGWFSSTGGVAFAIVADTLVTLAEDHTLTAAWTPNTYTVTFDADGGEVAPVSKTVTFNAAYGTLPTPVAPPASRLAWLFGGWVAAGGQPVTDATLVATASDHTLCAVWIEPAPLPDPEESPTFIGEAPYYGYLYRAGDVGGQAASSVEGTIEFNVSTATGKLSAKAVTRRGPLNFRAAAWDADEAGGAHLVTLTRPGGETLALSVRGNRAWGTLSGGSLDGELLVECAHNRFRDHADAEAQSVLTDFKGLYTAALPPYVPSARRNAAGGKPQGAGYLSVSLGTYGRAKFAGVLADGTSVSMAAQALLIDGCGGWVCVPFFSPLYGRKGWIGGLVWLDPETGAAVVDRELGWMIRWDCTRGDTQDFSLLLDLCGGRYVKPPVLAPAYRFSANVTQVPLLYPGGTALFVEEALPIGLPVMVVGTRMTMVHGRQPKMTDGAYDYSGENCALAKLSFSASTGIYKGTFSLYYDYISGNRPRHKKVTVQYAGILCPVRGTAFADAPTGMGHCLVPDNSTGPTLKRSFLNMLHEGAVPAL
jgi:uncharacterized repeat protein (TIGR02543 family)